jgi:hypothetical protein
MHIGTRSVLSTGSHRGRLGLAVFALGALLIACGGGDSDSGSTDDAKPSVETEAPEPSSSPDSSDSSESGGSAGDSGDASGGESIAIVEVNGVTYTSTGGVCYAFDENFTYEGPGVGSDGMSAYVFVGVEEPFASYDVRVVVGGSDAQDYQDDQPSWVAWTAVNNVVELSYVDGVVTGQGQANDVSQVAIGVNETAPITVQRASCG